MVLRKMKLSIPIPVYNFAEFLPETLRSILSQERVENTEIMVVDGASTDNTPGIMREVLRKISKFKISSLAGKGRY